MRFDAGTNLYRISTCRVTTHKEAAAEAIRATVTYLTAVQHTGSYGLESKPTKHRSSNKARSVRHDPAAHMGEVRRREASERYVWLLWAGSTLLLCGEGCFADP